MEISVIIPHIEAIIFASEKPVTTMDLVELVNNALGFMEDRANLDQVESALDAITEKYGSEFYPFQVLQSGGGWQFLTKKEYHATISQLNGQKFLKKLSTAALETLSIIAYKQPITKGEIEEIRGVNCDYAVQKLLEKELIIITGRKENAPGQPLIYATSKTFMDYFGINSSSDLPQLGDVVSQEVINPTTVGTANMVDEDMPDDGEATLLINDLGEIVVAQPIEEEGTTETELSDKLFDEIMESLEEIQDEITEVKEENAEKQHIEKGEQPVEERIQKVEDVEQDEEEGKRDEDDNGVERKEQGL